MSYIVSSAFGSWAFGASGRGSCCCPQRPTTFRAKRGRGALIAAAASFPPTVVFLPEAGEEKEEEIGLNKLSALEKREERRKRWERGTKEEGPTYERRGETTFVKHCTNKSVSCYPIHSLLYCTYTFKRFCFLKNKLPLNVFPSFSWIRTDAYVFSIFCAKHDLETSEKMSRFRNTICCLELPPPAVSYIRGLTPGHTCVIPLTGYPPLPLLSKTV